MKYYVVSSLVISYFSAAPPPLSQTDYITIGIVVGAVSLGLVLVLIIGLCCIRKWKKKKSKNISYMNKIK